MGLITETTMAKIKSELVKQNQNLRSFVDLYAASTWDTVQLDVKTLSDEALAIKYPIGTELTCHYIVDENVYDFVWVVLDIRDCEWQDGTTHRGLWLGAKYCTVEDIQFDAPENTQATEETAQDGWYYFYKSGDDYVALNLSTGDTIPYSTYTTVYKTGINNAAILRYGYNRYSHSAQRQWLNSSADAGEWWTSQHNGDVAPSQLNARKGFIAGLDEDFVAVVTPVKIQVATNTVTDSGVTDTMYDKFFLQSRSEMYGNQEQAAVEGAYFPYWKQATGYESATDGSSTNTNNARKIPRVSNPTGSAAYVRLRSAYRGTSYYTCNVSTSGLITYGTATNSYAALPACVIS